MTLLDAALVLDQVDVGQIPDLAQAARGLQALDFYLMRGGCEQSLDDAAATLELLVATGGTIGLYVFTRNRAKTMADAVRQAIGYH